MKHIKAQWKLTLLGLLLTLTLTNASAKEEVFVHASSPDLLEKALIEVLDEIQSLRYDQALKHIEALSRENPKFKLAHLIYADLLLAMAEPVKEFGADQLRDHKKLNDLLHEARVRWEHHQRQPETNRLPASLLQLAPSQRHAIVVDLKRSRLYLYENRDGEPRFTTDYYVSQGRKGAIKEKEGDLRTPIGVYHVTSHISGDKLPDLYGAGAFPVNYPNEWDRRQGKTGNGIWVHGNPNDTYSRPPLASEGCVTLSNRDFRHMMPAVEVGDTPVVFTDQIEWLTADQWADRKDQYRGFVEQWRRDWESQDSGRYLSHYSREFRSGNKDYDAWSSHKQRVNSKKRFIQVSLSDVSMFDYPDEQDMVVVEFKQDYQSSNYSSQARKRQYWRREDDGVWRIFYEGSA